MINHNQNLKVASLSVPYYSKRGYDSMIVDTIYNLYGVFDGIGVSRESAWASRLAQSIVSTIAATSEVHEIERRDTLRNALLEASRLVRERPGAGTTATIAQIDEDNILHYAHAGDSRLYVLYDGRVKQVTADEGYGNLLLNWIGSPEQQIFQYGSISKWDAFMLCTDGITGDWEDQLLSDEEIEDILTNASPDEAAESLVKASKKNDDKSIIVVYSML